MTPIAILAAVALRSATEVPDRVYVSTRTPLSKVVRVVVHEATHRSLYRDERLVARLTRDRIGGS